MLQVAGGSSYANQDFDDLGTRPWLTEVNSGSACFTGLRTLNPENLNPQYLDYALKRNPKNPKYGPN